MKAFALAVLTTTFAAMSHAATTVLDPGPGTDYLAQWCGGQAVNEIATGFDASANAVTLVKVSTTCHGSGRGSPNQYYLACWTVSFGQDGVIASKLWLTTNHWVQGNPAIPCPVPADPAAVYTHTDGAGNFPATLSTAPVGTSSAYRAVLDTTCNPIGFGGIASGTISAPGESACYAFGGSSGNGIRVSAAKTAGSLVPAEDVRRPDGSVLCGSASGSVDCTLDASGLHTIVVRDASGTATGDYTMSLTRTDVPHLNIGMIATLASGRLLSTIDYQITVSNDGGAPATGVLVQDTLPQGLSVRSMSSTQGSCSHAQRAVTCTAGTLAPSGTAVLHIIAGTALASGQVINTACVETSNCATTTTVLP